MSGEWKYLNCAAKNMRVMQGERRMTAEYDSGAIKQIKVSLLPGEGNDICFVEVIGANGEIWSWHSSDIYYTGFVMYGIPITQDGKYMFVPTFSKGLLCLSLQDGHLIWKSKSRAEYSHILVGSKTLCTAKSRSDIQLIDIETGDVRFSYHTPFDNRFEVLNDKYILNHSYARYWEVISSLDLSVVEKIP